MRSLNARVTVGAGVVLAVFIALSAVGLERAFRDSARSARHERLLAQVYLLMAQAEVDGNGTMTLSGAAPEPRFELPDSGLYAAIRNGKGEIVWKSRSALSSEPPVGALLGPGEQSFDEMRASDGRPYFLQEFGVKWATAGGGYPFTFSVAEDLSAYEQQLGVYRHSLWTWLGAMALLLLAAQWLILRWGLRPLRSVADELGRLEAGEQQQISGAYPSEIKRLTDNLNALLTRERAQQKRYRDALADLAHSLKTPLTLVRNELRRAPIGATFARSLEDQVERMDRAVSYHLQRASASGRNALAAALPVRPVVDRLVGALAKVHGDKRVAVDIDADDTQRVRIDEGDLTEILGNLLDNAFKWCRSRVRVALRATASGIEIEVDDDGPGIAPDAVERVMERGVRADESVPGHGIGLAVVRDIVRSYEGRIGIERSAALGGAALRIHLPSGAR